MIKHYGLNHQTVIVILVSMICISCLSKFGNFGRCEKGKVSFTNVLVRTISSHTHTHKRKKKEKKKKSDSNLGVNDMDKLHVKVWKVLFYY